MARSIGSPFSLNTWMVAAKPAPTGMATAAVTAAQTEAGVMFREAARNGGSASTIRAPPADARSAAAFSPEMRTTTTGGHVVPRGSRVRVTSTTPRSRRRCIRAAIVALRSAGAIMYSPVRVVTCLPPRGFVASAPRLDALRGEASVARVSSGFGFMVGLSASLVNDRGSGRERRAGEPGNAGRRKLWIAGAQRGDHPVSLPDEPEGLGEIARPEAACRLRDDRDAAFERLVLAGVGFPIGR